MDPHAAREEGSRLGPYELVRPLGRGSGGEVWEAVLHGPAGFRKPVALKLLGAGRTDATRELLLREARLGAALSHPNLVSTLQLSEVDGAWCLALELVRGVAVSVLCRHAGGRLPPGAVLDVGIQAAAGLQHLHAFEPDGGGAGLVHRDVKPGNLLVDRAGTVKLADLGIALLTGEPGRPAGTPGYMAPEQAEGEAEPRSDLFALGAVLYAVATGLRPFGSGGAALVKVQRVEALLASDEFLAPVETAVPGLARVLRSCLRHDPADRPASAKDVGDALQALRVLQPPGPTLLDLLATASPELRLDRSPGADAPTRVVPVGNLRASRDRFVGRSAELVEVRALVRDARWVVLVGPGGAGKTRLALEVARSMQHALAGHAWAFDLSEARTAEEICGAIGGAIGLELERADPVGQIGRVLDAKGDALVVLDNLEQCVTALPATVGRWLDAAPSAAFLGTSRVVPGLAGERLVPLGELLAADAAALFHARAPRPVSPAEAPHVEALVEALERMPLAIELAAARSRMLDVGAIRSRLSLALLAGGGAERPERHRSVHASLRWSWELLSDAGRRALAELAVFAGGFDLAAGEAVLGPAGRAWALDLLQELADASLLQVDPATGRFGLRATVQAFAAELLAPDEQAAAEARHGAHHAQLGSPEALLAIDRHGGDERFPALAREVDNLVAACRRAAARGAGAVAVATLAAADAVLSRQGPVALVVELAERVVGLPGLTAADRAQAERIAGWALQAVGRSADAARALERAVAAAREQGDERAIARALGGAGALHQELGRHAEARPLLEEALATARARGDRDLEGTTLTTLAHLHVAQGRMDEARALYERALALLRELGNPRAEAIAVAGMATSYLEQARLDEALACFERALALSRASGHVRHEGAMLDSLGIVHFFQGRVEVACMHYEQALAIHRAVGNRRLEAITIGHLANADMHAGRTDAGHARLEQALAIHREMGDRRFESYTLGNLGVHHLKQGRPEEARRLFEEALAMHRERGDRRTEGIVHGHLARLHLGHGSLAEARAHCERAVALTGAVGARRNEGGALVTLARIAAREAGPRAGLATLDRAEQALRDTGSAAELAMALAVRAELSHAAGETPAARSALAEAATLVPWHAEVAAEVARVRALVEADR